MRDLNVVTKSVGTVGSDMLFQARIVREGGSGTEVTEEGRAVVSGDVTAITCTVYDLSSDTPNTPVATPSIDSTAFIALTEDNLWNVDPTGCNFRHTVAGSVFTAVGHTYLVDYFVTVAGRSRRFFFEHHLMSPRSA